MPFTITLQPSARGFTADGNETILAAALRHGINLPYGCRNGACGSCKARLENGRIEYGDNAITGISTQDQAAGWILLCQAHPRSDLVITGREAGREMLPVRKLPCRVARVEKLNRDVLRLLLRIPASERLPFLSGQYIDVLLPGGKRRSFSLANAPHEDEFLELHIRHYDGGVFSEYAFHELKEKTLLRIEGPLGTFCLNEASRCPIIMVAGGTGFAPLRSIIEDLRQKGVQRHIHFYWGARSKPDLYLHELASEWSERLQNFQYIPVLSDQQTEDHWHGKSGLVHEAVLDDFTDLRDYEVYACGPPPMVRAVRDTFTTRGLNPDSLYSDSFEFAPKESK